MKKFTLIAIAAFSSVHLAFSQTEVVQGVMQGKDYGVVYTLPKTELEVDLNVSKVTYTPGEFSKYAERYLRLSNVSVEPEQYWLLNKVTVRSVGVADAERTYFIKLKDKTVAPLVELTAGGLIKSINVPYTASIEVSKEQKAPAKKKLNPKDLLTEEILTASSTAKMAELTAREIYSIRESRNALARGQADNMPKDGEQLKLMLNILDEQETTLMQLFTGVKEEVVETVTLTLDPTASDYSNEVVARFSKKLGVLSADNLAGDPLRLTLTDLKSVNIPVDDGKKKELSGVAYNVPGKASVILKSSTQTLFESEILITQFGTIEYLAPALFNKSATVQVIFNPETGGLIKIDRE